MTVTTSGTDQVRRYFDLIDEGDVAGSAAMFTEDSTYHRPGHEPFAGPAGVAYFYRELRPIRAGRHTLTSVLAAGSEVAVHGEFHGVLHDGSPVDLRFADFFVLDPDGRFRRRDTYFFAPLV